MKDDDDDLAGIKSKRICAGCVGDGFLKREIKAQVAKGECAYCGTLGKTMEIDDFATYIGQAFEDHFELTSEDYGPYSERQGDPVGQMIQEAAQIDEPPAEDVRVVLEDRNQSYGKDAMYDENPFSEEAHYQDKGIRISEYAEEWAFFRKSILTEARLFNGQAEAVLARIFEGLEDYATAHGKKVIVNAGPGEKISGLYRARAFHSDEKLEAAIARPDIELGPPPPQSAIAGRMNSKGIGVFYGATHRSVALAEIRPPVGSRVLVGRFEIIRPLRLLDVGAMQSIHAKGSIFEAGYVHQLEKTAFLWTLSERITQPVMPDDETAEYLVTQAIADYLATRNAPEFDGIIYPSVQQGGKLKRNVVLFHKSARVTELDLPRHTKISAHVYEHDEEGTRPDYWVSVRRPPQKKKEKPEQTGFLPMLEFDSPYLRRDEDMRRPSLRIDLPSIKVHHINRVQFGAFDFEITRHEYEMSAEELAEMERRERDDNPF